jgi:NhaP-type Na+/H+ or K+/H+ antiporter
VTVLDDADFMLTSSGNVMLGAEIQTIYLSSLSCVRATVHDLLLVVGERGWWLPIFFKQNKKMCHIFILFIFVDKIYQFIN